MKSIWAMPYPYLSVAFRYSNSLKIDSRAALDYYMSIRDQSCSAIKELRRLALTRCVPFDYESK